MPKKTPKQLPKDLDSSNFPLFLVTRTGERHEDHIPESFVTFSQLKQFFHFSPVMWCSKSREELPATEENMVNSDWCSITCLNVEEYNFTPDEILHYTSHGDLPDGRDFEDAEEIELNIIHVRPTKRITRT